MKTEIIRVEITHNYSNFRQNELDNIQSAILDLLPNASSVNVYKE